MDYIIKMNEEYHYNNVKINFGITILHINILCFYLRWY
jgi:hypothetical protein